MNRDNDDRDYRHGYRDSRMEAWNNGSGRRDDRDVNQRRDDRDMNYGGRSMNYDDRGRNEYRRDEEVEGRWRDDRQHAPDIHRRYDSHRDDQGHFDERDRSRYDYGNPGSYNSRGDGYYGDNNRDNDNDRRRSEYGARSESNRYHEQHTRDDRNRDNRQLDADDFREYHGRDAGFSWNDGSNPTTWRDMDRWGDQYSNSSRHEGIGWNRGSSRNHNFLSSERD